MLVILRIGEVVLCTWDVIKMVGVGQEFTASLALCYYSNGFEYLKREE